MRLKAKGKSGKLDFSNSSSFAGVSTGAMVSKSSEKPKGKGSLLEGMSGLNIKQGLGEGMTRYTPSGGRGNIVKKALGKKKTKMVLL